MSDSTHVFAARITELREAAEGRVGRVSVRGARALVVLDLVPEAREGDTVLVHAGVALSLLRENEDEGEARPETRVRVPAERKEALGGTGSDREAPRGRN